MGIPITRRAATQLAIAFDTNGTGRIPYAQVLGTVVASRSPRTPMVPVTTAGNNGEVGVLLATPNHRKFAHRETQGEAPRSVASALAGDGKFRDRTSAKPSVTPHGSTSLKTRDAHKRLINKLGGHFGTLRAALRQSDPRNEGYGCRRDPHVSLLT